MIAGDRLGGKIFLEQYGGLVRSVIRKLDNRSVVMEFEDLFMEALCHLFGNNHTILRGFRWHCELSTYVYRVTYRYIPDLLKKENGISCRRTAVPNTEDIP